MSTNPLILSEAHRELLLQVHGSKGVYHVTPSYPPAIDLYQDGYCTWKDDNPNTWMLELTVKGHDAVTLLLHPESDNLFQLQEIDDKFVRIIEGNKVAGFAVMHEPSKWKAYNANGSSYDDNTFSSPESVLLAFKMADAYIDMHLSDLQATEFRI
jgi:hypothetical protein